MSRFSRSRDTTKPTSTTSLIRHPKSSAHLTRDVPSFEHLPLLSSRSFLYSTYLTDTYPLST